MHAGAQIVSLLQFQLQFVGIGAGTKKIMFQRWRTPPLPAMESEAKAGSPQ